MKIKQFLVVMTLGLVVMALVLGVAAVLLAMAPSPVQAESDAMQSLRQPFVRRNHTLIYDQDNGRLILFGGWNGRRFLNDVWALELDTGTWYQVQPTGAPPPSRAWHAAVLDSTNNRMVVIGGKGYGGDLGDVWALDLTPGNESWAELEPEYQNANFSPRRSMAASIGPWGVNLFGGIAEGQLLSEMAVLGWTSGPGNESWSPPAEIGLDRSGGAAVWHAPGHRFALFGGADQNGNTAEVHTVAESYPHTVTLLDPGGNPPAARRFHTAVYYQDWEGTDLVERMVIFGGLGDSGFLNDVWELRLDDGQEAWQEITTTGGPPPPRAGHAAVYVEVEGNNRMYVVGGFGPYDMLADRGWVLDLDTNTWQPLIASVDWPKLDVSLQVEGAREGVVVNTVPDSTLVVNVKLSNYYADATENLTVTLTVHGNVLDFVNARMRNSEADPGYAVPWTDLGSGQFQVRDVDLYLHGNRYQRVVEFQFNLPADVDLGYVPLTAQVQVPGHRAVLDSTGVVNIVDRAEALVVTNRSLLYERYDEAEVNDLLAGLFQAVQGGRWNENPMGVVVYLDRYTTAENWDNTAVDYSDEWTANSMANEIAAEIHHFYAWADAPEYLLIVGDDDLIPFYRHWDGTEYEGIALHDCDGLPGCEHPGWCEDSETNPAIHATDENYYFTDDFYANMSGSDWLQGELELAVGRLVGETAADMLTLLRSGTSLERPGTHQVALFSLGGWQLGQEPTTGPDAIPNLLNVPARFGARLFEVRNDEEWPRTVDVMTPYDWGQDEFDAILDDGFDLFFEGADVACGYREICPAHAVFGPVDVRESRVSTDRPIFYLADAHAGLTVPAPEGGASSDLVLALAREGSSAIIGSTSTSLGSAYSLDYCVYSERFAQGFFSELLAPLSGESVPLGVAMREAKQSYPFGLASMCGGAQDADERTITTHVLYGVPWQTLYYPEFVPWIPPALPFSAGQQGLVASAPVDLAQQTVGLTDSGSYSQTFTADFTYTVTVSDGWDILTVPGARLDASDGYPLLPSAEVFTLCLPLSATVTGLQVVDDSVASIGPHNIPNVQVQPFGLGGLFYTTTSAVNTLYPATVITGERRGHLFVVRAMPVQHNPIDGETWFHNHIEVRLTYTTPTPVAVCGFATNARRYLPGQTMGTLALLQNVGDANLVLTPTLALLDPVTQVRSLRVGASFELPGGGVVAVPMTGTVPLEDGGYRAAFSVWDQGGRKAMAVRSFAALGGYITALEPSGPLLPGRANQFAVTLANPWPDPTIAFLHLAVVDASGQIVDELSPQVIAVTAVSTATATFDWTPVDLSPGQYTATAWVTARGQVYGPLSHSFRVEHLYLPLVFRQTP